MILIPFDQTQNIEIRRPIIWPTAEGIGTQSYRKYWVFGADTDRSSTLIRTLFC
jgi:hypothetical protein